MEGEENIIPSAFILEMRVYGVSSNDRDKSVTTDSKKIRSQKATQFITSF